MSRKSSISKEAEFPEQKGGWELIKVPRSLHKQTNHNIYERNGTKGKRSNKVRDMRTDRMIKITVVSCSIKMWELSKEGKQKPFSCL